MFNYTEHSDRAAYKCFTQLLSYTSQALIINTHSQTHTHTVGNLGQLNKKIKLKINLNSNFHIHKFYTSVCAWMCLLCVSYLWISFNILKRQVTAADYVFSATPMFLLWKRRHHRHDYAFKATRTSRYNVWHQFLTCYSETPSYEQTDKFFSLQWVDSAHAPAPTTTPTGAWEPSMRPTTHCSVSFQPAFWSTLTSTVTRTR